MRAPWAMETEWVLVCMVLDDDDDDDDDEK